MRGELSPVMTAAIVTGLRVKKETIGEITAAAEVMREFSNKVHVEDKRHLVDIVGTGGDGANTFNISTCSIFVIAAAGGKVRSEEHTSELQSPCNLVCRLLLEKKKKPLPRITRPQSGHAPATLPYLHL